MGVMIERKKRIMMAQGSQLPSSYRKVEYIEATGTQFVNTGYAVKRYDAIQIRYTRDVRGGMRALFSSGGGTYQFIALSTDNLVCNYYVKYFASGTAKTLIAQQAGNNGEWYTISVDGNGLFWSSSNDASILSEYEHDIDGDNNLYIFKRYSSANYWIGKISYFKIENNGTKVMELIPCVRKSDDKPGMYDTVSKTFYTNAGTGEFIIPT